MAPLTDVVVLSHGIVGSPRDTDRISATLQAEATGRLVVLQPDINDDRRPLLGLLLHPTLDGVMSGAARLADWMEEHVAPHRPCRLSLIGHSLGGVYLRAAIAMLADRGFLADGQVRPWALVTFATPHLGIRGTPAWWLSLVAGLLPTGRDLLLETPALPALCDDAHLAVLARFRHRALYGNVSRDGAVAYHTSLLSLEPPIECRNPDVHVLPALPGSGDLAHDKVCAVLHHSLAPGEAANGTGRRSPDPAAHPACCAAGCTEYDMLRRLATLDWDRYPVQFEGSQDTHCLIIAHTARDPNGRGLDVVRHMVLTYFSHLLGLDDPPSSCAVS